MTCRIRELILVIGSALGTVTILPQSTVFGQDAGLLVDRFVDVSETTEDEFQLLIELIEDLVKDPINLTFADRNQLLRIRLLSVEEIEAVLAYRDAHGSINRWEELDLIDALSDDSRALLRAVTAIDAQPASFVRRPKWETTISLNIKRAPSTRMPASTFSYLSLRRTLGVTLIAPGFRSRIKLRNEPGERHEWKPNRHQYGFDQVNGYASWTSESKRFKGVVGSYSLEISHGLLFSHPFGVRLSTKDPHRIVSSRTGLRGYTGSSTADTHSGLAVDVKLGRGFRVIGHFSKKHVDSRKIAPMSLGDSISVVSRSSLHASESQRKTKGNLTFHSVGAALSLTHGAASFGAQWSSLVMDRPSKMRTTTMTISRSTFASLYGSFESRQIWASGEIRITKNGISDFTWGAVWALNRFVRIFLKSFQYLPFRQAPYFNAFGAKMSWTKQRGSTTGFWVRLDNHWKIAASLVWISGQAKETVSFLPQSTRRFNLHIELKTVFGLVRVKSESNLRSVRSSDLLGSGSRLDRDVMSDYARLSLFARVRLAPRVRYDIRLDANRSALRSESVYSGVLFFQRMDWDITPFLGISCSYAHFSAPKAENRFYIHEPDVEGEFAISALSNRGSRESILVHVDASSSVRIQLKMAVYQNDSKAYGQEKSAEPVSAPRSVSYWTLHLKIAL